LVPVNRSSSRSVSNKVARGSSFRWTGRPFTVSETSTSVDFEHNRSDFRKNAIGSELDRVRRRLSFR